jgi:hypothetical protein
VTPVSARSVRVSVVVVATWVDVALSPSSVFGLSRRPPITPRAMAAAPPSNQGRKSRLVDAGGAAGGGARISIRSAAGSAGRTASTREVPTGSAARSPSSNRITRVGRPDRSLLLIVFRFRAPVSAGARPPSAD